MTFRQSLNYVLRHLWLWPLEFWLRPLTLRQRIADHEKEELISAILGGAVWGLIIGLFVWYYTGFVHAIWIPAIGFVFAFAFAFELLNVKDVAVSIAVSVAVSVAVSGVVVVAFAYAFAFAFAVAVIGVVGGVVGGAIVFAYAIAGAGEDADTSEDPGTGELATSAIVLIFMVSGTGIWIGLSLLDPWINIFIQVSASILFLLSIRRLILEINSSTWSTERIEDIRYASWLLFMPISVFTLVPRLTPNDAVIWGITLMVSLSIGGVSGFTYRLSKLHKKSLRVQRHKQSNYLLNFWLLFVIFAIGVYFSWRNMPGLDVRLDIYAIFFALGAPLVTGLPLYPFLAAISLFQSRKILAVRYTPARLNRLLPIRFQTFAYPLPGLQSFLVHLTTEHGMATGMQVIQKIQQYSLQIRASRLAVCDLARDPKTAIEFCGHIAIHTNATTLTAMGSTGPVARSIAALSRQIEKDDDQPLLLIASDLKPTKSPSFLSSKPSLPDWLEEFESIRILPLIIRLNYAIKILESCDLHRGQKNSLDLLSALRRYAGVVNLRDMIQLKAGSFDTSRKEGDNEWMVGGWKTVNLLQAQIADLENYREFATPDTRREFLVGKITILRNLSDQTIPVFWTAIGKELIDHWVTILETESKQAKEWLNLDVLLPQQRINTGTQSLLLEVGNPSTVLASDILLQVDDVADIYWRVKEVKYRFLEPGKTAKLRLQLDCNKPGMYPLKGVVTARDPIGELFTRPLAFRLNVGVRGKNYTPPDSEPYYTGEGLGSDRAFVGRTELLHWLRGLWKQPEGKPAVALVGQRRIGKTSLLNKIVRDGLAETNLIPIKIDIQGCNSEYDFLSELTRKMALAVQAESPVIDRREPYAALKNCLSEWTGCLNSRRFLIMLDEVDLIPQRHLGDLLPGFLRSLMQDPDYPVLLLFCGTHALKQAGKDYSSILFNTAQFRTVSYMNETEAQDVLSKPAQGILEFDPTVLAEAYRLTQGQPLLLQLLGATLIQEFNTSYFAQKEPGNYVDLNIFEKAVETMVRRESNMAFENYWADTDVSTHRVLSALAAVTDETNRQQLDIDGIETALNDHRLTLSRKETFLILQRLTDEEILFNNGPTYRFAVPLYRRWIAWRWRPEKVREEA